VRDEVRILGIRFGKTVAISARLSWGVTVGAVRAVAWRAYHRTLRLDQRIQFVRQYLFAKMWYVAQILPPSAAEVRRLEAIAGWYIWHGATCRVPLTTLQLPRLAGGWGMEVLSVKCAARLYGRLRRLGTDNATCTALLLRRWRLSEPADNPSSVTRVPTS
jgi:hypothetical protein